ncbi:hypothetical protein M407DRAFT_25337 [Tulasnella calospora MUT 4182]|uniref:NAD(P)-binding protein n=1 Tax=Tulasnella calospora MUT 4182 TaxID=1051891 RepID=A0A0C3QGC7_9AGAM|nr:hypothetical protein M407DRAFT_25337 [Tulasnella calospora MUT 4182]
MSEKKSYAKANKADDLERRNRTLQRLQTLQNQLASRPQAYRLTGKVCIITGVASKKGIGRATAFAYAHEGARHLYLLDFDGAPLPELKQALEEAYPNTKVTVAQGDAADDATIATLCKRAIEEEERLDVFFANAGIATAIPITETSPEHFMKLLRVNTLSCFIAIKHASAAMRKNKSAVGGSIIMTASVAGLKAGAGDIGYSVSKAAVNNLAQVGASQLTGTDIRVNSICPGLIETGMTTGVFDYARSKGTDGKIGQLAPLQRYAVAEEIAQVATFLACDDSSFVNGQNIVVDGGHSASLPFVPGRMA